MNNKLNDYIEKLIDNSRFSHAYLIEVDDSYNTDVSITFAKKIAGKLNEMADFDAISVYNGEQSGDLVVIRPDGKFIKKEQLIDLMTEYKTKSLNSNVRIYIIEYAENLNSSSANTVLKFLEEPEDGIIAVLITRNKHSVMDTIVSRCQNLSITENFSRSYDVEEYDRFIEFLNILVSKKDKAIAYSSDIYFLKSDQIYKILTNLSIFYENVINIHYNIDVSDTTDTLKELMEKVSLEDAMSKLKILEKSIRLLEYNVNPRIVLDRFFYEEDIYDGSV